MPESDTQPAEDTPYRVLIVDDDRINRLVAMQLVKRVRVNDWPVVGTAAEGGRGALEMLELEHFDLVLMDLEMPDMDGLETTRAIRLGEAGGQNLHIPVVAMTGHNTAEDEKRCLEAGMDACLVKPLSIARFEEVVGGLLNR